MAARIPMIATTIISSMSVKPRCPPLVIRLFRQRLLIRPPFLGRASDSDCKGRAGPGTAGDYAIDARFFRGLEVRPPRTTGQPCPRWAAPLTEQGNNFGHRPARVAEGAQDVPRGPWRPGTGHLEGGTSPFNDSSSGVTLAKAHQRERISESVGSRRAHVRADRPSGDAPTCGLRPPLAGTTQVLSLRPIPVIS